MAVLETYRWIMSNADPRVRGWPLMETPWTILIIIGCYVYLVTKAGPRWMKDRSPMAIEPIIIVYNLIMVIVSALFFYYGGQMTYIPPGGRFNLFCEPIDYSRTEESLRLLNLGWWLLILKMIEFLDTIFFVIRKKFDHISVLHVTHHAAVPWGLWIGLKFGAGGHNAFFPLINLFVHTVMYAYYCLSAFGPKLRPYLWWKRYITIMQMVQFAIATVHSALPLWIDCGFQPFFVWALLGHAIFFWILFYRFYRKRYFTSTEITKKIK